MQQGNVVLNGTVLAFLSSYAIWGGGITIQTDKYLSRVGVEWDMSAHFAQRMYLSSALKSSLNGSTDYYRVVVFADSSL